MKKEAKKKALLIYALIFAGLFAYGMFCKWYDNKYGITTNYGKGYRVTHGIAH